MGFLNTVSNLLKKAFPWLKNKPITSAANTQEGHNEHVQPDAAEELSAIPPRQGMSIPLIWYSMWTTITSTGRLLLRPPVALAPGYLRLQGYFERRLESLETRRVALANDFVGRVLSLLEGVAGSSSDDDDMEQGSPTSARRGRMMRPIESIIRRWLPKTMIIASTTGLVALFLRTMQYVQGVAD